MLAISVVFPELVWPRTITLTLCKRRPRSIDMAEAVTITAPATHPNTVQFTVSDVPSRPRERTCPRLETSSSCGSNLPTGRRPSGHQRRGSTAPLDSRRRLAEVVGVMTSPVRFHTFGHRVDDLQIVWHRSNVTASTGR